MREKRRRITICGTGTVALAACLILSLLTQCLNAGGVDGSARSDAGGRPLELILVSERESWLLLAAAPVAARVKETGRTPVLVAVTAEPTEEQRRLLSELLPSCNSCTIVSMNRTVQLSDLDKGPVRQERTGSSSLLKTTLLLAGKYWQQTPTVMLCKTKDPELGVLGSTLAAHMNVPFIACHGDTDLKGIHTALKELTVSKVLVVGDSTLPRLLSGIYEVEQLDATSLAGRTIGLIGTDRVRNIILVRTPDSEHEEGNSSWMAPYLSVMRRAPVVLCSTGAARDAEERVINLVERYNLRPETVTILADYDSIGTKSVTDGEHLGEYELNIEPCSGHLQGWAAPFGVGRIPLADVEDASRMIAGTVARDALLEGKPASVVMIANPDAAYDSLPLAGAVSRTTAEEFKNCGVEIAEFYGKGSSTPEIVEAATKAGLIIYEGHITSQMLFQDPCEIYDYPEYDPEFYYEDTVTIELPQEHTEREQQSQLSYDRVVPDESNFDDQEIYEEYSINHTEDYVPHAPIERLLGFPVVVLQSCHSLEEPTWRRVMEVGGVGLIGTVTNVHSASGSAFIKAFCDGLLYRNLTVGEALIDARNYFLCLTALKKQRGHKEMAKAYRVALSFRYWGDPQIRLFPQPLRAKKDPISATLTGYESVKVSTPRHRLPVVTNEKYSLRMFPGSQVAGIVRRLKNKPVRRIMPLYFFRLKKPAELDIEHWRLDQIAGDSSGRSVFLADPLERFLYVLYFPDKETKSDEFLLPFVK
jgi:hypothetical protein